MIEKINVLGRDYRIAYEDLSAEQLWGEHDQDAVLIRVDKNLTDEQTRSTIVHEVVHAILFEAGLNKMLTRKLEESICRAVEHGLFRSGLIKEKFE